jgi:potassium/hydrogen antiporter
LFIGAALGGTSSAVVVGLVKKVDVQPKTATTLIIESAESDVFTLAIPLAILGLMVSGDFSAKTVISQFVTSLILAIVFGVLGAFFWAFILNKLPKLKATKFSTPAFLFMLYGLAEYLGYSGPLTALTFGIAIGNLSYFEPKILRKIVPNQRIVLPEAERVFFSEIVFLLRTFFFVFIGISIRINRIDWLLWGALITFVVYLARIIVVKLVISSQTPVLDRAVMSFMAPKGLGAAVIATLPLQQGHKDGVIIQSVCFAVILASTVYCVLFFFLVKTGFTMPFYRLVFGSRKSISKK